MLLLALKRTDTGRYVAGMSPDGRVRFTARRDHAMCWALTRRAACEYAKRHLERRFPLEVVELRA